MPIISEQYCNKCDENTPHEEHEVASPHIDDDGVICIHKCMVCGFESYEYADDDDDEPQPKRHIDSKDCWCEPILDYENPETGSQVWVHRRIE